MTCLNVFGRIKLDLTRRPQAVYPKIISYPSYHHECNINNIWCHVTLPKLWTPKSGDVITVSSLIAPQLAPWFSEREMTQKRLKFSSLWLRLKAPRHLLWIVSLHNATISISKRDRAFREKGKKSWKYSRMLFTICTFHAILSSCYAEFRHAAICVGVVVTSLAKMLRQKLN